MARKCFAWHVFPIKRIGYGARLGAGIAALIGKTNAAATATASR
jgi:hypothetical protein